MQQTSPRAFPSFSRASVVACAFALSLVGCGKREVGRYSVPKETAANPSSTMPADAPTATGGQPSIGWSVPTGWTEQPASGMRVGSFAIQKDGKTADVSVIPLAGGSGGELANVNRWRGQVGLPPVEESKLTNGAETVSVAGNPAPLFDLAGTDSKTQQPTRILGAILSTNNTTWFFKVTGNDTLVAQEKPNFVQFLKSIQIGAAGAGPAVAQAAPAAGMGMGMGQLPPGMDAPANPADRPTWDVPPGWQSAPPSAMRLATFVVSGPNGAKADVSIIKLGGMAGGLLANVNRWRGQVGLPPVDEAGLAKATTTEQVDGKTITMVDVAGRSVESGDPTRLLAAVVPGSDATYFYKMLGNDQLVAQQKEAFIKFVKSARYPNA